MMEQFDILEYLSGLTSYVLDKAVLKRIALERDVLNVSSISELDIKTRELLRADVLYAVYLSPNVWASVHTAHGNYAKTIGSQTIYNTEKERLYNIFTNIYRKYDDEKVEDIKDFDNLQWLDM